MQSKKNIVWIASYPKSGNTWFRLILNCILYPDINKIDINNINSTATIASSRQAFDKITGTNSSDLTFDEINLLRPQVYKHISFSSDSTVFIKTHDAWGKTSYGNDLFPTECTKGVILIVRNPFEIAISLSNHAGITIKEAIRRMNCKDYYMSNSRNKLPSQLPQLIGTWSHHYESWVDNSGLNIFVIKFEDMKTNPIQTFHRAFQYLGIDCTMKNIIRCNNLCSFNSLKNMEIESGFKEKPIRSKSFFNTGESDTWKNLLDKTEIHSLLSNHEVVLRRIGYI